MEAQDYGPSTISNRRVHICKANIMRSIIRTRHPPIQSTLAVAGTAAPFI